ncbi:MAG: amidohydrolase family protein [Desulfobacterales bacterium]|nr:amidohydrolase family protein [Desulfobacterales bacterium]
MNSILAGWMIDGTGGPVQNHMLLQIKNGYIHHIRKAEQEDLKIPGISDLSHCTILPGLIDSHVHLFMSGTNDLCIRKHQLDAEFNDVKDVISHHISQLLLFGIFAVRDGGDKNAHALRYKKNCLDITTTPILLNVAGKAWHKPNRYGRLIGKTTSGSDTLSQAIEKDKEKADIDHIKIVNSGINSLTQFGKETLPQFDLEEMTAAVKAADRLGLKTMVHANGKIPVRISADSGCHSVEHGFFMGKDNLKRLADKNITWVPTAVTMKAYSEQLESTSPESDISRKNLEHQLEQIFQARESGVTIALGTDAGSLGVFHGFAVIEEMKLLMESGFTIQEAVRCATFNGAKLLNIIQAGLLTREMQATFIAVKGDPSNLPDSLMSVQKFYVNGELVFEK